MPAVREQSVDREELREQVRGGLERPVHDEVLRVRHAGHVLQGPKEEGAPELRGVAGIPQQEGLPGVGCEEGRRKDEVF